MKRAGPLVVILLSIVLAGCAGNDEQESQVQNLTDAYTKAQEAIAQGNFRRGIQIFEAIQKIKKRFDPIKSAEQFTNSDEGMEKLDAICMQLIAVGESLKNLDKKDYE